jgi:hypothetical protein
VLVPQAADIAEMSRPLLVSCQQDESRSIGLLKTVGAGILIEREQLLPLAEEGFDVARTSFPQDDD